MAFVIAVIISTSDGLMPAGTKPLHETITFNNQQASLPATRPNEILLSYFIVLSSYYLNLFNYFTHHSLHKITDILGVIPIGNFKWKLYIFSNVIQVCS